MFSIKKLRTQDDKVHSKINLNKTSQILQIWVQKKGILVDDNR